LMKNGSTLKSGSISVTAFSLTGDRLKIRLFLEN
jgi:hypothetical protein